MARYETVEAFEAALQSKCEEILANEITELAKDEITNQLGHYAFPYSRGPGGLSDRENFEDSVSGLTLTIRDVAPFQGTGGGSALVDVVEGGNAAYHMPGPRPFMKPAEAAVVGPAEAALQAGCGGL